MAGPLTTDRVHRTGRRVKTLWILATIAVACVKQTQPPPSDQLPPGTRAAVLQHHNDAARSGVYVDPALTRTAVRGLRQDGSFNAPLQGSVYAQPLYWDGGDGGQDLLIVATQRNEVIAFDPLTGSRRWARTLASAASQSELPCGDIDPLGITGTPIIDPTRRLLFVDAMTAGAHHRVFAISLVDGSISGTPVDLDSSVSGFSSVVQNQRGALALQAGILYVPYSGHYGDCGDYAGWVVGIDTTGARPAAAYRTGKGGGIWAMPGVATMDGSLFVATGNTIGLASWNGGEAILKLAPGPSFSGASADYYAPATWKSLDATDTDIGTAGALPFDVGASHFVATLGKDGRLHLADRDNLGGVGGGLIAPQVAYGVVITAPSVIATPSGTILAFPASGTGCSGANGLVALRITPGSPPSAPTAWCASVTGNGSTMATTTGSGADSVIWVVGARGDNQLHAVNAETGEVLYTSTASLGIVERFNAPIAAKGRIYVAGTSAAYAFTVR